MPLGRPVRPGSMGRALPGFRLWIEEGELCVDPATVPTFFLDGPPGTVAHRRPRARGRGRLPVVRGAHRRRDHLLRVPHRPLRGGVGARLPRGGGGGGRGGGAGRRARPGGASRGGAAPRSTSPATPSPATSRPTPRSAPPPTSTRASWTSPPTCPRRKAARSADRACASSVFAPSFQVRPDFRPTHRSKRRVLLHRIDRRLAMRSLALALFICLMLAVPALAQGPSQDGYTPEGPQAIEQTGGRRQRPAPGAGVAGRLGQPSLHGHGPAARGRARRGPARRGRRDAAADPPRRPSVLLTQ